MDAIKSQTPQIIHIALLDETICKAILFKIISSLTRSFNVGKTMNDKQIGETIDLILKDTITKNFKPEDFIVCFEEMKKGTYGKNYDRIDVQTIFEGMYAYWHNKALEMEQISIKRHFEAIREPEQSEVNPEGQKKVIEIFKQAKEAATAPPKVKPLVKKSERDVFLQKCLTEFDNLYEKNPVYSKAGRFVSHKGKNVDLTEYLELRVKEYDLNPK